jgi:hypothetical protein
MDVDSSDDHRSRVTPEPPGGDNSSQEARRIFGLSVLMFWSIIPLLAVALILILVLAL